MALHFSEGEFAVRSEKLLQRMREEKLDAMLLFAQESMYWLTGYDTFGFCFFQCLVFRADGSKTLLARSADLRQARHTSNILDIRIWIDRGEASPIGQLKDLLFELDLLGTRIGVEYETHGMTGKIALEFQQELNSFADLSDASSIVPALRAIKSPEELVFVRKATELADLAHDAGLAEIRPGAREDAILAAMQSAVLDGGGDYPANEFIVGSGRDALLCRYKSGSRVLEENDQITLEWAGVYRHYHSAAMRTVIIGQPTARHNEMYAACRSALAEVEKVLIPGKTMGDLFEAHAQTLDALDMMPHRLNSCGYSLGARFAPSWMDRPMAYKGNPTVLAPNMVLFMHMILMDSVSETAMTLGQTYLVTENGPEALSRLPLDLEIKSG